MKPEWHNILRREASAHHMCAENRHALDCADTEAEAIALYIKTIDWALEEGYPSIEVLRRYFTDCEEYGIFVDKVFHGELLDDRQVYVFHHCKGTIRTGLNIPRRRIPMLYFANGCEMSLLAKAQPLSIKPSMVPLYVFGENHISTESDQEYVTWRVFDFETK